jgi:hypothetical protein
MRFAMGAEHDERDHDACGHCSKGPLRALVSGWGKFEHDKYLIFRGWGKLDFALFQAIGDMRQGWLLLKRAVLSHHTRRRDEIPGVSVRSAAHVLDCFEP